MLIARDRNKATADEILPDRSAKSLSAALEPVIAKTAVLVSDGAAAILDLCDKAGPAHVLLNLSEGQPGQRHSPYPERQQLRQPPQKLDAPVQRGSHETPDSYPAGIAPATGAGLSLSASRAWQPLWG